MRDYSSNRASLERCRWRRHWRLFAGVISQSPFITTIITSIFALFIIISNPARAAEVSIRDVLPGQGFTEEWGIDGKVELYDKDTLFNHINGEAEIYFPYGFDALASANYINKRNEDLSIVADVYRMASVLDAFGIYANYRKVNNSWITVGAEGFASNSQLMFYQDRYFVRLQVSGETNLPKDTMLALARAISHNLPVGVGPPKELEALKIPALVPKSERYLAQSLLGYAFFRRGMIADAVVQDEKMQIFVISENTEASARKTFDQYYAYLKAEGQGISFTEETSRRLIIAVDPLYGGVQMEQSGRYIAGLVRVKNNSLGKKIMEQLSRQVRSEAKN